MLTAIPLVKGPSGAGRANHFLDGSAGGPSIDQHIAQAIGGQTLLPSLELGVESNDTFLETLVTHMCYGNVDPNDPIQARGAGAAGRRPGADLHAPLRHDPDRNAGADHARADEQEVGARLRQLRLQRPQGEAGRSGRREARPAPDQHPQHRGSADQADPEPGAQRVPGRRQHHAGVAGAREVPARPGPAHQDRARGAGAQLLRHQLPRDRQAADGSDDPRAQLRPHARRQPAVVDRGEHGDPHLVAARVQRHARAPPDDPQRDRRRRRYRRRRSIR